MLCEQVSISVWRIIDVDQIEIDIEITAGLQEVGGGTGCQRMGDERAKHQRSVDRCLHVRLALEVREFCSKGRARAHLERETHTEARAVVRIENSHGADGNRVVGRGTIDRTIDRNGKGHFCVPCVQIQKLSPDMDALATAGASATAGIPTGIAASSGTCRRNNPLHTKRA